MSALNIARRPVDRWRITGMIKVVSPIAIHTGEEIPMEEDKEGVVGVQQGVALDKDGNPYIPASALKGLIRRLAASHDVDTNICHRLLGDMARKRGDSSADQTAWGGAAEFRHAFVPERTSTMELVIKGQTAIDRGARSAKDTMLRQGPIVPAETKFKLDIIIDRAGEEEAQLLLDLLTLVDGNGQNSTIGSGNGRISLTDIVVYHWDAPTIKAWVEGPADHWLPSGKPATLTPIMPEHLGQLVHFPFALRIDGYLLSGVPIPTSKENEDRKGTLNAVPYRSNRHGKADKALKAGDEQRPEIPASGFDGALRAQAERIYRTIIESPETEWTADTLPAPIAELFGSTKQKGLITPDDLIGDEVLPLVAVNATAQDRITGGAYATGPVTRLAFEAPTLATGLSIRFTHAIAHDRTGQSGQGASERSISAAAIGLLALTIRDLAEGDVPLASGTRNGYGHVAHLGFGPKGDWRDLLRAIAAHWDAAATSQELQEDVIASAITAFVDLAPDANIAETQEVQL